MYIVEIMPIGRSFFKNEALTYFSTKKLEPGALVEISVRNKNSLAIAVSIENLETKKASLKKELFPLKKINKVLAERLVSADFLSSIREISDYFLASSPSLANFFLPKIFLKKEVLGKMSFSSAYNPKNANQKENFKVGVYQAERPERLKYYRAILRETLGQKRSCAVILPTQSLAEAEYNELKTGLEDRCFLLHGELSAKNLASVLGKIYESADPIVTVGTPHLLAFLRPDTGTLIIDEESSEYYYNSRRRPFFDVRKLAEVIAKKMNLSLISGDIILKLAIDSAEKFPLNSTIAPDLAGTGRLLSQAKNLIIDSREKSPKEFRVLSQELIEHIRETRDKKESLVLVGYRRGLNPTTLCQDCGEALVCKNCSSPLVLHQSNKDGAGKKYFFCHYCLKKAEAAERCPNCGSWKLANYGVGVEKIGEELKRLFPEAKLFRFDSDAIKSRKEAERVKKEFADTPGSMLVATEIFINFFKTPLPHIAVAAIDGLFSIPDYGIHERIAGFLMRLRSLAQKSFVIQTRLPDHPLFEYVASGNMSRFKSDELEERKKLGYPPAVDMIKITLVDTDRAKLVGHISALADELKKSSKGRPFECVDFPAFVMKIKGSFRWHILLKLERGSWPASHPEIKKILAGLPSSWSIQVNSPSLL
ncbi:MAG: hypothetical protein A2931_03060 [Candidatus Niyogibacteria bacterium RIFCSPLOWO2_01_FULL_45_48]|uniref:Primosomal protein N n=2 Tax=Candidatus Niyogiibacteriota TaxID=1817912 RepID=A0A1G2EWC9_9BACT|nr:MAG: hypothetical protein A3J00_03700 [Candidatus Niyogibacteria bacterium RIFCSPLOWO2_02_FULL_45_13]OGZ30145.1 MAG: hypothetical protein A2931_03060 [Candidatus Niyogibacteria bacterium RIFCSPLOWO2_01_FULL_45_48]